MKKLLFGIITGLFVAPCFGAIGGGIGGSFIQNQNTLQNNATFYVSSGTVSNLHTSTITFSDGTSLTTANSTSSAASSLQTKVNGVQISSPTKTLAFDSNFTGTESPTGTSNISLSPGTTLYIHNSNTLQTGTTFYVSSGTVGGPLSSIRNNLQTILLPSTTENFMLVNVSSYQVFMVFKSSNTKWWKLGTDVTNMGGTDFDLYNTTTGIKDISISTSDVMTLGANVILSPLAASQPVKTNSNKQLTSGLIDVTSDITGTVPDGNLPSNLVHTNNQETISGSKVFTASQTFTGNVVVNSTFSVPGSTIALAGTTYYWQAGLGGSGKFLQNNNGTITSATPSGGGGAATLPLPGGATNYIQNTGTLQSGATFYVSSGSVRGQLSVYSVPSSGGGNTTSYMTINLNNNSFSAEHDIKIVEVGGTQPDTLRLRNQGSDGTLYSDWVMGSNSNGTSLQVNDQSNNYIMSGSGAGGGSTILLSTGTNLLNLSTLPSVLSVVGVHTNTNPLAIFYDTDGGGDFGGTFTPAFEIDHSSAIAKNDFYVASGTLSVNGVKYGWPNADGSSGQFLKTDGSKHLSWGTSSGAADNMGNEVATTSMTMVNKGIFNIGTSSSGFNSNGDLIVQSTATVGPLTCGQVNGRVTLGNNGITHANNNSYLILGNEEIQENNGSWLFTPGANGQLQFSGVVSSSSNFMLHGSTFSADTTSTFSVQGVMLDKNSSAGTSGQYWGSNGAGASPTWQTATGASLSSTQTWTGGNTFTSSATFTSTVTYLNVSTIQYTSGAYIDATAIRVDIGSTTISTESVSNLFTSQSGSTVTLTGVTKITGSTLGDSAAAGIVGEQISSAPANSIIATANTWTDAGSITLTAGDWDLSGTLQLNMNGASATSTDFEMGISSVSGNSSSTLVVGDNYLIFEDATPLGTGGYDALTVSPFRVTVSASTTYYLKGYFNPLTSGNPKLTGRIRARRMR